MQKTFSGVRQVLDQARVSLKIAQEELNTDRMNGRLIEQVRQYTMEVLHWNDIDEALLQQKSKVDWIRMGDGNNSYFHATVKAKNRNTVINCLQRNDGTIGTSQHDIEQVILECYHNLVGTNSE